MGVLDDENNNNEASEEDLDKGKVDNDDGGEPDKGKTTGEDNDGVGKGDEAEGKGKESEPTGWEAERLKLAGGDEKLLKRLERYGTRDELIKAGIEAQNKIGKGLKAQGEPGPDASEGEIIDYRKANNIPEAPEKYQLTLDKGLVVGEEDKPLVEEFQKLAHTLNLSNEKTSAIVNAQLKLNEQFIEARADADVEAEQAAKEELAGEDAWGGEMKRNLNHINAFLDTAPEGVKDAVWGARLADGTPMASDVGMLKWLNSLARQINPVGTIVPQKGASAIDTLANELETIEGEMAKGKDGPYYKGPGAVKMQKRYLELLEMREKHDKLNKK